MKIKSYIEKITNNEMISKMTSMFLIMHLTLSFACAAGPYLGFSASPLRFSDVDGCFCFVVCPFLSAVPCIVGLLSGVVYIPAFARHHSVVLASPRRLLTSRGDLFKQTNKTIL